MALTVTETRLDKLTGRNHAQTVLQPRVLQPDTYANIRDYTAADLITGDTVYDTTYKTVWLYNGTNWEPIGGNPPKMFRDNFVGDSLDAIWTATKTTGTPTTVALAADAPGRVVIKLASTGEAELNEVDFNGVVPFDTANPTIMEVKVTFDVIPAAAGQTVEIGLCNARGTKTGYLLFALTADGDLETKTKGTTPDGTSADTGVNIVATNTKVLRIDATNDADIRYYVDGVDVTVAATDISDDATTAIRYKQPYFSVGKTGTEATEVGYGVQYAWVLTA